MKKISTLAVMAFLFCLSAMAQVELGSIKFSLGEGKKISPKTGKILITFPNVDGIDDPTSTNFVLEGNFGDGVDFDGIEASFAEGATLELADFELEPSTNYTLTITSVKVGGVECAAEDGYTLNFATRGAERKMGWTFKIDAESVAKIKENEAAGEGGVGTIWKELVADARHYYNVKMNDDEMMLDENTPLPMTEDLTFQAGAEKIYVGDVVTTTYQDRLSFNANNLYMTIPDCKVGDIITFNANRATTASSTKFTCIVAQGGAAIAPDGFESASGVKDSIQLGSSFANFKFKSQVDGDIKFLVSQCLLKSVTIEEAIEEVPVKYNIVAAYTPEGGEPVVLKTLVSDAEAIAGSTVKVNYSYWLADEAGNVYTHGAKGAEFVEVLDLKSDTTFIINYTKTAMEGAVYLMEGEDIEGALECTHANVVIRSSNAKAAYFEEDVKLTTLQPGTYKVRAIVFDGAKTAGHIVTLYTGAEDVEENEIYLAATATNWTEAESDLLTITEPTDITLKAGGNGDKGLDCIVIYASDDAPDDPDDPTAIVDVNAAQKTAVRKVLKGGQILFETEAGVFNTAGVQVK